MKTYKVKSAVIPPAFESFAIEDNGLGYLTFNIFEKIAKIHFGELGELIGCRVPTKEILIRPPGKKRWYSIKYEKNSSRDFLECSWTKFVNRKPVMIMTETYQHSDY